MTRKPTEAELARKAQNEATVREAITEGYLATGKALDASDIAVLVKWPVRKVWRVLADAHGAPEGIRAMQDHRETRSRMYPGMALGAHRVWVYVPTLDALRSMLNALRADQGTAPKPRLYVTDEIKIPTNFAGLAEHYIGGADAVRSLRESEPDIEKLPVGEKLTLGGGYFIERVQ